MTLLDVAVSTDTTTNANTLTLTDTSLTNGATLHMSRGRSQRCSSAAWNWNGMLNRPMRASAALRLAMKKCE